MLSHDRINKISKIVSYVFIPLVFYITCICAGIIVNGFSKIGILSCSSSVPSILFGWCFLSGIIIIIFVGFSVLIGIGSIFCIYSMVHLILLPCKIKEEKEPK